MTSAWKRSASVNMRMKRLPEITADRYLREIVEPTIQEFESEPTSVRRAMLACIVMFHSPEYFRPELNRQKLRQESHHFALVDKVAHAAKHRILDCKRPLRDEDVLDPIGGVTIRDEIGIDILQALKRTLALLGSKL